MKYLRKMESAEVSSALGGQLRRIKESTTMREEEKQMIFASYYHILDFHPQWGVDALKLDQFFNADDDQSVQSDRDKYRGTIFWQCPWGNGGVATSYLIKNFIRSASAVQKAGAFVFLGFESFMHFDQYQMNTFIVTAEEGYERLPDDVRIQTESLKYGYHHISQTLIDIHSHVASHLRTICLRKRNTGDTEDTEAAVEEISEAVSTSKATKQPQKSSSKTQTNKPSNA